MRDATQSITTINLEHEQMLLLRSGLRGRVRVLYGATWLTEEGEPGDTVLRAGEERSLGRGRALIQGLGSTRVEVALLSDRMTTRPVEWFRSALRDARTRIARLQLGLVAPRSRA